MDKSSALFTRMVNNVDNRRKCLGLAKNYFTNALKKDPSMKLPTYPWVFSKPLSTLCPKGQNLIVPKHAEKNSIYHEVELGIMLKKGGYQLS